MMHPDLSDWDRWPDGPDEDEPECCSVDGCGAELEYETCSECHGEGGWHDCGEDTCVCLHKDRITVACAACDGQGYVLSCPFAEQHPQDD